ncbi:cupredoxin domain-containing protein [Sulfitobacter geojensis]|uniref:hypothetical protein n=1 Tax=Sulfitobacter geojensis TaxID=1342299 RepID=UPI0036DE86BF
MLNSSRKGVLAVAAALSFVAGAAQADNHVVLIVDGSYFPSVVYANPGDNIVFRNNSDASHTVNGPEGSWTSGEIGSEAMYRLNIKHDTPPTFTGLGTDGTQAEGEIIFAEAPGASE